MKEIDPLEAFERKARKFYLETGMMAPGKDVPAAMGGPDFDERLKAWDEWLKKEATDGE